MIPSDIQERFEVLEELRRDDAEILLRARDRKLLREVLLKLPGPGVQGLLARTRDRNRVLREARALARVRHSAVVGLLEVLESAQGVLLVMEPVAGESLAERLAREGRLPPEEVRRIGLEVCGALAAVHQAGIVHRDVAEHTIVQRPDQSVCLLGFVFAKTRDTGATLSSLDYRARSAEAPRAQPVALPQHAAPEQLAGQPADPRSDLFALGCVLYRCLTGQPAFPDAGPAAWSPPRPARELAPTAPAPLCAAIEKCLARSPMGRYQTAGDLAQAVAAAGARGAPAGATPPRRRAPGAWMAAAAVVVAAVGLWALRDSLVPGSSRGPGESLPPASRDAAGGDAGYQPRYQTCRAVLIGIDYKQSGPDTLKLTNAERDVRAIQDALLGLPGWQKPNIKLLLGPEATGEAIVTAVREASRQAEPDDCLFLYFAGHGEPDARSDRVGWIRPIDGRSKEQDLDRIHCIDFDELKKPFERSRAKHILVALDCCFSGRITGSMRDAEPSRYQERFLRNKARFLIASSGSAEKAPDGPVDGHSPFAEAFLDCLRSGAAADSGAVTTSQLFARIQQRILDAPGGAKATPVWNKDPSSSDVGEFVFFLKAPK